MRRPTAKSLTLDLLSTLRGDTMPVAALVAAGELFGIQGGSVRVALTRLLAERRVERDERGRYRLGTAAAPIQGLIQSWRHLGHLTRAWDGSWLGVHLERVAERNARRRSQGALELLGFAELAAGLHVRPANLRADTSGAHATLRALGLESGAVVCSMADLDAAADARARDLWDAPVRLATYRRARHDLAESEARLTALPQEDAMVESFLIGGQVLQQLVLDPLLPDEILPTAERDRLVAAMRRYDGLGRRCWAGFLERFDVAHRATPLDTGVPARIERLRAS